MAARRREPRWLTRLVVDAIHDDQVREHGGLPGVRDENVLESALARPQQKWNYEQRAYLALLASAYAYGFVRNHPYRDGNKRIGFLVLITFLGINDCDLDATDAEVVDLFVALAAGEVSEDQLTGWVRAHTHVQAR